MVFQLTDNSTVGSTAFYFEINNNTENTKALRDWPFKPGYIIVICPEYFQAGTKWPTFSS